MKKLVWFFCAFFLLSIGGCESDDSSTELDQENLITLFYEGKIPQKIVEIEELPIWLQEIIEAAVSRGWITPLWIYQFSWHGSVHYTIYSCLCNGPLDNVFTQDGDRIDASERGIRNDIIANSSDWALIYEADRENYPTDSIQVNFKLLDMDGNEATTFAYGDNITFSLELTNSSSEDIVVDNDVTVDWIPSSEDLFMVYTKDGQAVGKPWDLYLTHMLMKIGPYIMPSGTTWNWNCKWKGILIDDLGYCYGLKLIDTYTGTTIYCDETMPTYKFYQREERNFLPKGVYYCQFEIAIGEGYKKDKRTCRVDFRIE